MSLHHAARDWNGPAVTGDVPVVPDRGTFAQFLTRAGERMSHGWAVATLSLGIITAACGTTLVLGVPHQAIYGHDIFTLLDGAWRVLQGQTPHVNFYSAFGPVFYLIWAMGLRLGHYRIEGLVYATALVGFVLGIWSLAVFRTRLGTRSAVLSVAFLNCFWLAPFPLGEPYYLPSYAMQYNRLGYAILAIILVELFGRSGEGAHSGLDWGGLSTGLALGFLLFMKANFFVAGLALCVFAYFLKIKSARHGASVTGGLLIVGCALFWYLHGDLAALGRDMGMAAGARQNRFHPAKDLPRMLLRNLTTMVTLLGLALLTRAHRDRKNNRSPFIDHALLLPLVILSADLVLSVSNQQRSGFPVSVVAVLLFADQVSRCERVRADGRYGPKAWVSLLAVMSVLPFMGDTVNAWAAQVTMRQNTVMAQAARIDTPSMAALVFDDHVDPVWGQSEANGRLLTSHVNEGIALLKQYSGPGERIACLCYANPFPYALLRPPISGGSPFFDYGTNFTERFAPSAERILGGAELVIYPKAELTWTTVATLFRICQPILARNYRPLAESKEWVLLKRI